MVGHHVAQGTGAVVEIATGLDTHGLGGGDLHVVDVVVVPEGLEQAVGKTADQDVLHGFLAQIMVDAIDLLLAHDLEQARIEGFSRGQVGAEGLLHHHPAKPVGLFLE
ncbi:hypothetical protein D9M71_76530 [compost metagenome]